MGESPLLGSGHPHTSNQAVESTALPIQASKHE